MVVLMDFTQTFQLRGGISQTYQYIMQRQDEFVPTQDDKVTNRSKIYIVWLYLQNYRCLQKQ